MNEFFDEISSGKEADAVFFYAVIGSIVGATWPHHIEYDTQEI